MTDARPPLLTAPFLRLMGAHFLQSLGFSSMILLPVYLDFLGASRAQIGAVMASSAIGGLLTRPMVGWALDTFGRKPTLRVGTTLLSLGMVGLGLITAIGPLAYAARLLIGVGTGALFTGYFTFASDLIPERRRTEGIALFGVSGLIPLAINPLATRLGVDPPAVRWFLPLVGLCVLMSLVLLHGVPEPRPKGSQPRVALPAVWAALRRRPLWSVWIANITFSTLVAVFMAFALVVADKRGIPDAADMWFAYAAGAISVRVFGATLPARLGPSRVLAAALSSYLLAMALLASAQASGLLWLAGLLAGVGHGYCFPILTSQVVTRSPLDLRGSAMSMFTGMWDATKLLAPPALGLLADARDDATMLAAVAVGGVAGMGLWGALEVGVEADPAEHGARTG